MRVLLICKYLSLQTKGNNNLCIYINLTEYLKGLGISYTCTARSSGRFRGRLSWRELSIYLFEGSSCHTGFTYYDHCKGHGRNAIMYGGYTWVLTSLSSVGLCIYQLCSSWRRCTSHSVCSGTWLWSSYLERRMGKVSPGVILRIGPGTYRWTTYLTGPLVLSRYSYVIMVMGKLISRLSHYWCHYWHRWKTSLDLLIKFCYREMD